MWAGQNGSHRDCVLGDLAAAGQRVAQLFEVDVAVSRPRELDVNPLLVGSSGELGGYGRSH